MPSFNRTVLDLAEALAAGRTSSRDLVEAALARVAAPDGEGARTFVAVYADRNGRRRRPGPMTQGGLCRLPAFDPARVRSPATSNRSFTETGSPASGPAARSRAIVGVMSSRRRVVEHQRDL